MNRKIIEIVVQIPTTNALSQLIRKSFRQASSTKTKYSVEASKNGTASLCCIAFGLDNLEQLVQLL